MALLDFRSTVYWLGSFSQKDYLKREIMGNSTRYLHSSILRIKNIQYTVTNYLEENLFLSDIPTPWYNNLTSVQPKEIFKSALPQNIIQPHICPFGPLLVYGLRYLKPDEKSHIRM